MARKRKPKRSSPFPMIILGAGLIFLAVALIVLIPEKQKLAADQNDTPIGAQPAPVNYPAPKIELTDLQSNQVSLEDYRGKVVMINNWATWCPPCRAEMPELEAYYRAHQHENFVLIGVNSGDKQADVANFTAQYGLTFPMWLDYNSETLAAFKTMALPSSFVIDPTGTVRLAWSGGIDAATLEEYVTPLLRE